MPDTKKLIMGFQQENPRLYEAFREVDKSITTIQQESGFGAGGRLYGRFYSNVDIAVPTLAPSTAFWFPLNSNRFINGILHDTATNNSKIFVPKTGWYNIGANIRIPVTPAGTIVSIALFINQTVFMCSDSMIGDGVNYQDLTTHAGWYLNQEDFVEFGIAHNDPAGFTIPSIPGVSPEVWISET